MANYGLTKRPLSACCSACKTRSTKSIGLYTRVSMSRLSVAPIGLLLAGQVPSGCSLHMRTCTGGG